MSDDKKSDPKDKETESKKPEKTGLKGPLNEDASWRPGEGNLYPWVTK